MNKIEKLLNVLSENADLRVKKDKEKIEWQIVTPRTLISLSAVTDSILINFKTAYMEEGRPTPASLDKGENLLVKREEIQNFLDSFVNSLNAPQINTLYHKTDKAEQYQQWIEQVLKGESITGAKAQLETTYNNEKVMTIEEGEITHLIKLPSMPEPHNALSLYEVAAVLLIENRTGTDYTYQSHSFSKVLACYQIPDYPLLKKIVLNKSQSESEDDIVKILLAKTVDDDLKARLLFFTMNEALPEKEAPSQPRLKI